ncbi:MAG TPA: MurR/RpiR family transcriptional regulator [Nitrospira sp.]|nr:MurR/RpiR family transcriptional regulator [Nitrospira sp.]
MNADAPFFKKLRSRLESLPRNQRALADYISGNYQAVAFATISQLADLAGVSSATIVRFAKSLDFDGYPALQREIRRLVRADLKGTDRYRLAEDADRSVPNSVTAMIQKEMENISGLADAFDQVAFEGAVTALQGASEVLVSGSRSAAPLANHLSFVLNKIDITASSAAAVDLSTYEHVSRMDGHSCLLIIGFPRYLQEQVDLLSFARDRAVRTVTITDSPFSPLQGDVSLYAPAESASFQAFHSAPLILINALLHEIARADEERTLSALRRFEALAEATGHFYSAGKRGRK